MKREILLTEKNFDVLFKEHYAVLCAYARRFVEQEDAEEIVQEVMITLWENRSKLVIDSSLSHYLFKATYNKILNMLAHKEVKARAETHYYTIHQQLPDNFNIHHWQLEELSQRIEEAIAALPESYRTAFVMHRFKNMSYKEIAETLQVSPKTIDYRIQQALKLLKNDLKDYLPAISFLLFYQDLAG